MSSYFSAYPVVNGVVFFVLFSLLKLSSTEESENVYLKSSVRDIPIFSSSLSTNPHSVQRRNDFFLKAGKSVPRIGRRNDDYIRDLTYKQPLQPGNALEDGSHQVRQRRNDFFFKAHKTIPRIGRRNELAANDWKLYEKDSSDFNGVEDKQKSVVKKDDAYPLMNQEEAVAAWPWFRNPELFAPYQEKKNYPSNQLAWFDDSLTLGETRGRSTAPKGFECSKFSSDSNEDTSQSSLKS